MTTPASARLRDIFRRGYWLDFSHDSDQWDMTTFANSLLYDQIRTQQVSISGNGLSRVAGKTGFAVQKSSGTSGYLTLPSYDWEAGIMSFVVGFQYTVPTSPGSNQSHRLVTLGGVSSQQTILRIEEDTSLKRVSLRLEVAGGTDVFLASATGSVSTSGLYQIACVINTYTHTAYMYLNGTLAATSTWSGNLDVSGSLIYLDWATAILSTVAYDHFFVCPDYALNAQDVAELYNGGNFVTLSPRRVTVPDLAPAATSQPQRGVAHQIQLACLSTLTGRLVAVDPATVTAQINGVLSTHSLATSGTDGFLTLTITAAEADISSSIVSATTTEPNALIKAAPIFYRDYISRADLPELDNLDRRVSETATPEDVDIDVTVNAPEVGAVTLAAAQPHYAPAKAADVSNAIAALGGRSIQTVNPVGEGGRVDLVIGDDYSSEDGRQLKWIVTGGHASIADAEIILAIKQASAGAIQFVGEVAVIDADQGKYLISVNLTNVDTSELLASWTDYQLIAVISGRRNTLLFGRSQQTPSLI